MADKVDPGLRAATRGLKAGSPEYQKAVKEYNKLQAETQGAAEARRAEIEQKARDAEAKRVREAAEAEAKIEAERTAAKAEKDRNASLMTSGIAAGTGAAGLAGAAIEDKLATKKADKILAARAKEASGLAEAARKIDPNAPGARGLYQDIGSAAKRTGAINPRVIPYKTSLMAGGLGALGAYSTWHRAPQALSDEERALWTGMGYGELGAGAKMAASAIGRYRNPGVQLPSADVATIEGAMRMGAGKERMGGLDVQAQAPSGQSGPVQTASSAQPSQPQPMRNSERLIAAARAAGATGRLTKESAAKFLARNVKDSNRTAVATALGVKPGQNYGPRIKAAIKDLGSRGKSGFLLPAAMGLTAYQAHMNPAEAGSDGAEAPSQLGGLAAGATAAGATAAVPYAISKLPASAGRAFNAGGPGMAPTSIDSMTDYSPEDIAQFNEFAVKNLPEWMVPKAAYMGQVPERNPARPTPGMFGDMPEDQELQAAMEAFLAEAQQ